MRVEQATTSRRRGAVVAALSILLGLAVLVPGLARAAPPVSYAEMENGGLFFPAEIAGYVIPATTVSADVDIAVNGLIARATVRQRFENPTDDWVEGVYVFPLPETAAVDRLRLVIGERVVEGVIEEREVAEQLYGEALEAGQQASLVSQERPNIFTNAVANIPPRESIVVEIEYQQSLAYVEGAVDLRFPTVVLPRYIPGEPISQGPQGAGWAPDTDQVGDASRVTPPVADPAFGPVNPVDLTVTLDAGFPIGAVDSPSHPITVTPGPDNRLTVAPAEEAVFADRDFVLSWQAEPTEAPTAAVFSQSLEGQDYHLVMLVPPETGLPEDRQPPREVVFIIDTSGSMAGDSIVQAREALLFGLAGLGPQDRFQIIAFNDVPTPLFAEALPATAQNRAQARRFVRGLIAENGTEMRAALEMALDGEAKAGRLRQVVFITDGAVGNEAALFALIHDRLADTRLFTVGIGSAPNSHFMREAAEAGRGSFTYIGATDEVRDSMTRLFARLENPALTDIEVRWPGAGQAAMYPPVIPDLYVGEPVLASVRLPAGTSGEITVSGRRGTESWRAGLALDADRPQASGVAALWARDSIADLERQLYRGADSERVRRQILDVALSHGLVSQYTSLVAIDEEVVRPPEADLDRQAVATNMPEGLDMTLASALPDGRQASLEAIRNMARFGTPERVALPMGATGAPADLMIGLAFLALATLLMVLAGRVSRASRYRF